MVLSIGGQTVKPNNLILMVVAFLAYHKFNRIGNSNTTLNMYKLVLQLKEAADAHVTVQQKLKQEGKENVDAFVKLTITLHKVKLSLGLKKF